MCIRDSVIAVATQPHIAAKTISNIQETMARGARVILLTTHGEEVKNVENTYYLPDVVPTLQAILVAIPLQLIAYYTACIKAVSYTHLISITLFSS